MRETWASALLTTLLVALSGCNEAGEEPRRTAPTLAPQADAWDLSDSFDGFQQTLWKLSDGYTNGPSFHLGWRADRARFEDSRMTLRIDDEPCPTGCSGKPFSGAELQSVHSYGYGRLEGRMKVARGVGIVASLFFYDRESQDEIDVEILGKAPDVLQTNYYVGGKEGRAATMSLGFDASEGFHIYAIDWSPEAIRWYVDDRLVHTETGTRETLPSHPSSIMANFWPGNGGGTEAWLGGPFVYPGSPVTAHYDWIRYRKAS